MLILQAGLTSASKMNDVSDDPRTSVLTEMVLHELHGPNIKELRRPEILGTVATYSWAVLLEIESA